MALLLSQRAQKLTSSAIREILKVTERPEVISFAGGLPSPATFPVAQLQQACNQILSAEPTAALQYGPTEGFMPLREWIARHHSQHSGVSISAEQVLVTTGSQQGLDLLAKVLIDAGSTVLVETPTYLGALQAFSLAEPLYRSVRSDNAGLIPEALRAEPCSEARFLYCLPNFQNPSGRRLPLERRRQLIEIADRAGLLVIEDDPYGELYYAGAPLPSLLSMNPQGVVYLGSFSKVLAPGLRVGYLIAPPALHRKLVQAKQAADLHTPSFTQRLVHTVIKDAFLDGHLPQIRSLYAAQCHAMLEAMQRHFPAGVEWNRPEGGMFIWVQLPKHIDSAELLQAAIEQHVAFVPGAPFYANEPQPNTLRLSFVTVPPPRIEAGIARLGALLAARMGADRRPAPAPGASG
jgi:2-aminoadipate transaminase